MRILSFIALSITLITPVFAGEEGYAKSVAVQTVLKTSVDGAGQPIQYPKGSPEISGVVVEIPAGQNTGWHVHPCPCVAYVLDGEITVEFANGNSRQIKAGEAVTEVVGLAHCGFNRSARPARILMFVIGEKGVPISKPMEK